MIDNLFKRHILVHIIRFYSSYAFTTTHPSWLENCLQKIYFFVNAIPLSCNWLLPMAVHFWCWEGSQIKNCLKFLYTLYFKEFLKGALKGPSYKSIPTWGSFFCGCLFSWVHNWSKQLFFKNLLKVTKNKSRTMDKMAELDDRQAAFDKLSQNLRYMPSHNPCPMSCYDLHL